MSDLALVGQRFCLREIEEKSLDKMEEKKR